MGKLLLASLLAAIGMMAWAFVFWVTPLGSGLVQPAGQGDPALMAALSSLPASGVYYVPGMAEGGDEEAWAETYRTGPIAHVFVSLEGREPMPPTLYIWGFLHMLVTGLLLAFLLTLALPALGGFGARVGFVFLAGLAAAIWGQIGQPIWFFHSWGYHIFYAVYDLVSWLVAGLILAAFIKPKA